MTLLCEKKYCFEIQRSENQMQPVQNLLREAEAEKCCLAGGGDDAS
jgi:hypothetical protein